MSAKKDEPTPSQQRARDAAKKGAEDYGKKVVDDTEKRHGRR